MDKTQEYVKMSDDPTIQDAIEFKIGEHYVWWDKRFNEIRQEPCRTQDDLDTMAEFRSEFIILLSQDQLQAMVIGESGFSTQSMTGYLVSAISDFAHRFWIMASAGIRQDIKLCPASMEQLWLAFVQKTKFNKLWDVEQKTWREK